MSGCPGAPVLELARRLVQIPSVTSEGTVEAARFLRDAVLSGGDLDVRLDPGPDERQVNLVASRGPRDAPILLNSHLDTVPPGDAELWTECGGDPFAARVVDDLLYGLGSADAKLDALCKALALRRFTGRPFRRGVVFAATFGEERGLLGARQLVERLPVRPLAAWAGEPTELELVTRHKGLLVLALEARSPEAPGAPVATTRLVVRGRSAHSSTPHLGDNAITRALDLVELRGWRPCSISGGDAANKVPARCELEVAGPVDEAAGVEVVGKGRGAVLPAALVELLVAAAREVRKLSSERPTVDDTFSPPHRTANLGRLEARGLEARLVADVRTLPGEPVGPVRRRFEELAEARRDLGVDVSIERENPALSTPDDAPVVVWSRAVLGALGLPTSLKSKAGCTEAGLYAAAGIPSVVFGPGLSAGNIHAPNEHVPLPQIDRAVEFYSRLIEELCLA